MTDFAWASTETRKIVKGEERIVYFLDHKQGVRQTEWEHLYAEGCARCSLREICGGLFDRGRGYDPAELSPVFVDRDAIVRRIIEDPSDPSYPLRRIEDWRRDFARRLEEDAPSLPRVGQVTDRSQRLHDVKRRHEARKASASGIKQEPE